VSAEACIADALLQPVTVAGLSLSSRIVMAPMSRYFCPDGMPHGGVAQYYARRAAAGVGLIISEGTYIGHPSAASYERVPDFHGAALTGWRQVCQAVHAAGGKMFPQLWHTGSFRQSWMGPQSGVPGLGPSENTNAFTGYPEPTKSMTDREIAEVISAYAEAAGAARDIGFDGVELHAGHGYLIDEFLWSATNRRDDVYGGNRRQRTRFATEVVTAIRRQVGPNFPISFRFSQWKQQDYKARLAETPSQLVQILEPLADAGVSIFHCSTRRLWEPAFSEEGDLTLAGWARKLTGLPVIAVGGAGLDRPGLNSAAAAPLDNIAPALSRGDFDLLAVGRALIADPLWAMKIRDRASIGAGYDKELLKTLY
jgi:2,4-dienoyl-CoA reductase-like NADH-dependent reductase (Old Yellow Enzyme family)